MTITHEQKGQHWGSAFGSQLVQKLDNIGIAVRSGRVPPVVEIEI